MDTIFIRVAGGNNKGIGHLMRCMSLAKELRKHKFKIIFIINYDDSVISILNENNFNYEILKSDSLDDEIVEISKIIYEKRSIVITDSYWMSNDYLIKLKNISKYLISIDDMNLYEYPSDIIINSNLYANELNYKKNNNTKYLLGKDYMIFREEFINDKGISINKICKNVLVTMGGTDINNYTLQIIKYLSEIENIIFNVVVGVGFKNINQLIDEASKYKNINLIFNPKNMKNIMIQNDVAISASGTTSYELALLGIPSILIIQVDNQIMVAKKMEELGLGINAGWFHEVDGKKLITICKNLILDYEKRKELNENCKNNISSNGIKNIVKEIKKLNTMY